MKPDLTYLKKLPLYFLLLFYCMAHLNSQSLTTAVEDAALIDSLDQKLKNIAAGQILPGFAAAIFDQEKVLYAKGFGYRDLKSKKPYQTNTVQGVASVSKTMLAVALMKAVEDEKLSLDDDINSILPFKVTNPHFPDIAITIRHLATHTSSLNDSPAGGKGNLFAEKLKKEEWREVWHPIIARYNENTRMPMPDFLKKIFTKEGEWYSDDCFLKYPPGSYYDYSNFGIGLLAYIVELATGEDYQAYTQRIIFDPIGMKNTGWSKASANSDNHITYYNDNYFSVPHYDIITYPDGGLYTTVEDLTKFLQEMMRGYEGKSKLLSKASFLEMMTVQSKLISTPTGLIWDLDNDCCIGHGGNDFGIATMMFFNPDTGIGRILFTNIDIQQAKQEETYYGIFGLLFSVY